MNELPTEILPSAERRRGTPPVPLYGELLLDSGWRPTELISPEHEGWLRARGVFVDRRQTRQA